MLVVWVVPRKFHQSRTPAPTMTSAAMKSVTRFIVPKSMPSSQGRGRQAPVDAKLTTGKKIVIEKVSFISSGFVDYATSILPDGTPFSRMVRPLTRTHHPDGGTRLRLRR